MNLTEKDAARFWAKVAPANEQGCMLWMAYVDPHGYAQSYADGRPRKGHHISYILTYGPIPEGLEIDHVRANGCTNKHCVAPLHLEAVTHAENMKRGGAAKTHCINGHLYTPANTYVTPRGARNCRECRRRANRDCIARKRAA